MKKISECEPPKRMMIDVETLFDCDTCYHNQNGKCNTSCDAGESYRPAMSKLEIIEAEPVRHGRWIEKSTTIECSECGKEYSDEIVHMCFGEDAELNRCPRCGAHMEGKEN